MYGRKIHGNRERDCGDLCKRGRTDCADRPHFKTSKPKKKLHGIGIKEVWEFVSREEWEIEIFEEGDMFVFHVCLPIKSVKK